MTSVASRAVLFFPRWLTAKFYHGLLLSMLWVPSPFFAVASSATRTASNTVPAQSTPERGNNESAKPLAEIPFALHGHLIVLRGEIDKRPVSLVLNNQEPVSFLGLAYVEAAQLKQQGGAKKVRTASGWERRWPLNTTAIHLGGENLPESDAQIDGVLGADLFKRYVVKLEFSKNKMYLYDPKTYRNSNQGQTLDLIIRRGAALIQAAIPQTNGVPAKGDFLISLNNPSTIWLSSQFEKEHQLRLLDLGLYPKKSLPTNSAARLRRGYLEQIQLGSHLIEKPNVTIGALSPNIPSKTAGVLGFRFLHCFDLVFDYSRHQLIVQTNAQFMQARKDGFSWYWRRPFLSHNDGVFYLDLCGAELAMSSQSSNGFPIMRIEPGSAADRAGIRKGDVLLSLEGQALAKHSLTALMQALGRRGRSCRLQLQRGEERISADLVVNWMVEEEQ